MAVSTVTQNKENYNIQMSPKKAQPLPDNKQTMEKTDKLTIEEKVIKMLKTVYDPEIPVDIYELGMIYKIDVDDDFNVNIDMTLTAPNCPAADFIMEDVHQKISSIDEVGQVNVNLVFEPEWDKSMMSEEAKLDLGFL
jgi:FeS assembly SUF system protein